MRINKARLSAVAVTVGAGVCLGFAPSPVREIVLLAGVALAAGVLVIAFLIWMLDNWNE